MKGTIWTVNKETKKQDLERPYEYA